MYHFDIPEKHKNVLDALKDALVDIDNDEAKQKAQTVLDLEIDPRVAIRYSISSAAKILGEKFDTGEYFLPHLVMSGDLMEEVTEILEKGIPAEEVERKKTILIATVEGDVHSIGKNLVSTMLRSGGFIVHDLGVDVSSSTIINKANEIDADMIALSSLLTTTMPYQKEVIEDLESMGIRSKFKVMVGGGPVTQSYADKIGADLYGKDAIDALETVKKFFKV